MTTCGNNDLIDKKYSDAFNHYFTHENKQWNSVHAWDLGFAHFVCLNSNTDYTYVDNDGSIGGYANTDAFLQAQCDWLDTHLTEVETRATKPRWVICYMHLSPFTVVRTKRLQRFIKVFEDHKVDLVLCGHNHCFSRSKVLYTGYDYNSSSAYNDYVTKVSTGGTDLKIVDEFKADGSTPINRTEDKANGTLYVMCQATSYKLSGKESPINLAGTNVADDATHTNGSNQPWWYVKGFTPSQPTYCILNIAYDSINIKTYQINTIKLLGEDGNTTVVPYTTVGDSAQVKELIDEYTINYSDRNKA